MPHSVKMVTEGIMANMAFKIYADLSDNDINTNIDPRYHYFVKDISSRLKIALSKTT